MFRSLHMKLVLILSLLMLALMSVVGTFLINGVVRFYLDEFSTRMADSFGRNAQFVDSLRTAAAAPDAPARLKDVLRAYSDMLGLDIQQRFYFVLDKHTGAVLAGADDEMAKQLELTPNIYAAMRGSPAYARRITDSYMDCAVPIGEYIIYIKDTKESLGNLSTRLFLIILQSVMFGLVIAIFLSFLLSKTMTTPIENMTRSATRMALGDFSHPLEVHSRDEIGTLTQTFNDMADKLRETREAEQRLEAVRREFVSNVSHELRTPLTNIKSYAETLAEPWDLPPETIREFSGVIVGEADRMTRIVSDLLTLSRFDYGKMDWQVKLFSMSDMVRSVYDAMLMQAKQRGHTLELTLSQRLPELRGDRERLEQVLVNIVGNACKYTPDGGRIEIQADATAHHVWVSVSDNGIGVPPEDLPRLFERFYRVDKARSRALGGTGLGLAIAKEIVDNHRGSITLQNRPEGGVIVTVTLPRGGMS